MDKTKERNGVLIYVAVKEKKFAIVGDEGINKVVPEDFWESTKEIIKLYLSKGELVAGLEAGIAEVGIQLKQFFPYQSDDENELCTLANILGSIITINRLIANRRCHTNRII